MKHRAGSKVQHPDNDSDRNRDQEKADRNIEEDLALGGHLPSPLDAVAEPAIDGGRTTVLDTIQGHGAVQVSIPSPLSEG